MSKLLGSPNDHTGLSHDLVSASGTGQNAIFCTSGNVEGPPSKPTAESQPNTPPSSGPKGRCELKGHEPPPRPTTPPTKPPKGNKAETLLGDASARVLKSEPDGGPGRAPKPIPPPPRPDPVPPPPPPPACGVPTRSEPSGVGYGTLDASCEALVPTAGATAPKPVPPVPHPDPVPPPPRPHKSECGTSYVGPKEAPPNPLVPPRPKTPPPPKPKNCEGHKPPPPPTTPPPKPLKSSKGVTLFKPLLKFGPNGAPKPLPPYPDPVRPPPRPHEPVDRPGSLCSYANEWYGYLRRAGEGMLGAGVIVVVG